MEKHQSKIIIAFFILLFVVGTFILFYISDKNLDLDYKKNWWVTYFTQAEDDSLSFAIENHSKNADFRWEILKGKDKLSEGMETIPQGQSKIISEPEGIKKDKGALIKIKIYSGEEVREIYKNF